jgi:hypothetical protein
MNAPVDAFDWWGIAAAEFTRRIDDHIRDQCRNRVLPWEHSIAVGQVDYWRVHCFALDRLDELLGIILPDGDVIDGSAWRGRHDARCNWITVSLIGGQWSDQKAMKRGRDVISLCSHVYGMKPRQAAIGLGQWLGIEAVRHG